MPEEKKKISFGFYAFWAASMIGIVLISLLFFYLGMQSLESNKMNDALLNILMGIAGIGIAAKVAYDMAKARLAFQEEKQEVLTELHCPKCGRKMLRPFKEGDYVGKIAQDKCPLCSTQMVIVSIFAKAPKQKKKSLLASSGEKS